MAAAPFKRHAHENRGGGSNIPPAWGSAESQTTILQSSRVMGSGASDTEVPCLRQPPPSGMAEVGAATAAASRSAARAFQKQLAAAESQARKLQRYHAELAAANACLQSLTLPGEQPGRTGTSAAPAGRRQAGCSSSHASLSIHTVRTLHQH